MAVKFDYQAALRDADALIQEFGEDAVLRRIGATPTDRPCVVVVSEYQPRDEANRLVNLPGRRVIISALTPEVQALPPDNEKDVLVTFVQPLTNPPVENRALNFTRPIKPTSPAGVPVLYEGVVSE